MTMRRTLMLGLLACAMSPAALCEQPAAAGQPPAVVAQPPAAAAPQPAGESPVYNVEVLIFRSGGGTGGEDWSAEPALRGGAGTDADEGGGARAGRFVQAIRAEDFHLNDVEAKLRAAGGYQPIAHVAWSQTASAFGTRAGFTLQKLGVTAPGLGGIVFLERGQFLHLGLSLTYTPNAAGGPTYHLSEIRRVRFYEKNFYDQPAFGVIALVTPAQGARPPGR